MNFISRFFQDLREFKVFRQLKSVEDQDRFRWFRAYARFCVTSEANPPMPAQLHALLVHDTEQGEERRMAAFQAAWTFGQESLKLAAKKRRKLLVGSSYGKDPLPLIEPAPNETD